MSGETQVTIVGNLTDEPELRFTPGGVAVVKFSVAVNRRQFDRQTNEWRDLDPDFHRVSAWRGLAENIAETLSKGSRVIVVGDLRQSHWTDTKTGEKRSGWDVQAQSVGADLTWATATITKTTKGSAGTAPDDPWNTASRTRPPVPAAQGAGAGAGTGYSDEPPF